MGPQVRHGNTLSPHNTCPLPLTVATAITHCSVISDAVNNPIIKKHVCALIFLHLSFIDLADLLVIIVIPIIVDAIFAVSGVVASAESCVVRGRGRERGRGHALAAWFV